jgi:hypothetical protein
LAPLVGSLAVMATAAARKLALRQGRRHQALQARDAWRDAHFGIRVQTSDRREEYCRLEWRVDSEPVVALLAASRVRAMVDALEVHAVRELRLQGESWDDLGAFLAMTGVGAQRKFALVEWMHDDLDVEKAVEGSYEEQGLWGPPLATASPRRVRYRRRQPGRGRSNGDGR